MYMFRDVILRRVNYWQLVSLFVICCVPVSLVHAQGLDYEPPSKKPTPLVERFPDGSDTKTWKKMLSSMQDFQGNIHIGEAIARQYSADALGQGPNDSKNESSKKD